MVKLEARYIRDSLHRLAATKVDTFGAIEHKFVLNAPIAEAEVSAFESRHRIHLPGEYRHFLTVVGNGGAGPYHGVFPLGYWDGSGRRDLEPWAEDDGSVGVLSTAFPLLEEWNDLSGMPSDDRSDQNSVEYEEQSDRFDQWYFDTARVNGAIPICHQGCALRIWLVVTGGQAGTLWDDRRSEYKGICRLLSSQNRPATFSSWYAEWLEDALRRVPSV